MTTLRHPIGPRSLGLVVAVAVAAAACNATGATARPPAVAVAPSASSQGEPAGPTAFATKAFSVPFSLILPARWEVVVEEADMFAAVISTDGQTMDAGVDIQLVPKVNLDPCDESAGTTNGGSTPAELATWMLASTPLNATAGAPATIAGSNAFVVDEAFAGTPCVNGQLWPTSGGWLDASEQKRYYVFEVRGTRVVATIVSSDARFGVHLNAGLTLLGSLRFTT